MKYKKNSLAIVLVFLYITTVIISCSKGSIDNNLPGGGGGNTVTNYHFGDPEFVSTTANTSPFIGDLHAYKQYVTKNYIFENITGGVAYQTSSVNIRIARKPLGGLNATSLSSLPFSTNYGYHGILDPNLNSTTFFVIDDAEKFLYVLGYGELFKWDLTTNNLTRLATSTALSNLTSSRANCMRVTNDGTVYLSTNYNNGSILKISASGIVSTIVSNLIAPANFDINNNTLYVAIQSPVNGKVIKIDQNNTVTTLIDNIVSPSDVVIDNYSNMIVRYQSTLDGANYHFYKIYTITGSYITTITDPGKTALVSAPYENMPMRIDEFNNLYFFHNDNQANSSNITYCNPNGQRGIFKIALIKN